MGIENIKIEAMELSVESRAYLAKELISSLESLPESTIEKLWIDEAELRDQELDSGMAKCTPAQDVMAKMRVHGNK
jgi:hypothetical protein